jgi:hypothetical protein
MSPYTAPDILLGCYQDLEGAREAREQYIAQYQTHRKVDPWQEQGYKLVDLEKDVVIDSDVPDSEVSPTAAEVFVVSSFAEAFGQIIRKVHAICGSLAVAQKKKHELKKGFDTPFPEYCQIQRVTVGALLPDEDLQTYTDIH